MAADTVRERTVLEFLEFHATWIGCAVTINLFSSQYRQSKKPCLTYHKEATKTMS